MITNNEELHSRPGPREGTAPGCNNNLLLLNDLLSENTNWDRYQIQKIVADEWATWLNGITKWTSFVTLTFRENRESDVADTLFKKLVRVLNKDVYGNHYTRKVGHSYFSYVRATEFTKNDVIHFHCLIDKPVNFSLIHSYWGNMAGFAWVEKIKDIVCVSSYVSKYVVKGASSLDLYKSKDDYYPQELGLKLVKTIERSVS